MPWLVEEEWGNLSMPGAVGDDLSLVVLTLAKSIEGGAKDGGEYIFRNLAVVVKDRKDQVKEGNRKLRGRNGREMIGRGGCGLWGLLEDDGGIKRAIAGWWCDDKRYCQAILWLSSRATTEIV